MIFGGILFPHSAKWFNGTKKSGVAIGVVIACFVFCAYIEHKAMYIYNKGTYGRPV